MNDQQAQDTAALSAATAQQDIHQTPRRGPTDAHVGAVTDALVEVLGETKRGSPALLKLVDSVRHLLHAAEALKPEVEDTLQSFRGVFGSFHGRATLAPLPQPEAPAEEVAGEHSPEQPASAPAEHPEAPAAPATQVVDEDPSKQPAPAPQVEPA